jgi:hypothetical protein
MCAPSGRSNLIPQPPSLIEESAAERMKKEATYLMGGSMFCRRHLTSLSILVHNCCTDLYHQTRDIQTKMPGFTYNVSYTVAANRGVTDPKELLSRAELWQGVRRTIMKRHGEILALLLAWIPDSSEPRAAPKDYRKVFRPQYPGNSTVS